MKHKKIELTRFEIEILRDKYREIMKRTNAKKDEHAFLFIKQRIEKMDSLIDESL